MKIDVIITTHNERAYMANTDIMIDLETLATTPDATILTIGAVKIDPFGSEIKEPKMDSFYVKVDLDKTGDTSILELNVALPNRNIKIQHTSTRESAETV